MRAVVATIVVIGLSVLCCVSASDRVTADSAQPRKAYFGGVAAAQVAFGRLGRDDPLAALSAARRAVRTAPVDPSATSALGSALLVLKRPDRAYAAFSVSGMLGWRDIPTQLYWLAQGAAAGDANVLSERLDALLRLNISNDAVVNALHLLGQSSLGQAALAELLLSDPPWERRFLVRTGDLEGAALQGRMAAIARAAAAGASLDCEAVGYAAGRLVARDPGTARQLWREACDRTSGAFLSDGGFESDSSAISRSPFTWEIQTRGGLEVSVQRAPAPLHGNALSVRSSVTSRTTAARQLVVLRPGTYRLSWTTIADESRSGAGIRALVWCNRGGEMTPPGFVSGAGRVHRALVTFSVPPEGCPIQVVAIEKAASSPGDTETGWIDDVRITPLEAGAAASGAD